MLLMYLNRAIKIVHTNTILDFSSIMYDIVITEQAQGLRDVGKCLILILINLITTISRILKILFIKTT